jgi:hypothetical protein
MVPSASEQSALRGLRCAFRRHRSLGCWPARLPAIAQESHRLRDVCGVLATRRHEAVHRGSVRRPSRFTARFDGADPQEASLLLRRFYRCAEDVLFPDAVIDKLLARGLVDDPQKMLSELRSSSCSTRS